MLNPEYFDHAADDILDLYSQLDQSILRDIVRRLIKTEGVSDTAKWQIQRLQESGMLYDDIIREVAANSNASDVQVKSLFQDAGVKALSVDMGIYEAAGLTPLPIRQSLAAAHVLQAGIQKTGGNLRNLTMTTAVTSQQAYIQAATMAGMQVESGAFDYVTAIRNAVRSAAQAGTTVIYPSGHIDQLDVAVRRSTLTGVSQTAAQLSDKYADDMDCDLVETTAHAGARPSHQIWQGKVFSRSGTSKTYPDFVESTGYGTGDGLCGWNCRHSYYPYFKGLSKSAYPAEKIDEYNNRTVKYNDQTMSYYAATQRQRAMERSIRATKRELAGYAEGMKADDVAVRNAMKEDFAVKSVDLKAKERTLQDYLQQTGLDRQREREQVWAAQKNGKIVAFGRSEAQQTVQNNKRAQVYTALADTTTSTGLKVTDTAVHFGARAVSRDFSIADAQDALTAPLKMGKIRKDETQQFIGEHATVVINTGTGKLVTGWKTSADRATKLKGGRIP